MGKRRSLKGLTKAQFIDERPKFIPPQAKLRGAMKKGITYENKVAKYLKALCKGEVIHGQWIEYVDRQGLGWCQPDILIVPKTKRHSLVIVECKLTATPRAKNQLKYIYLPALQMIYPKHTIKLVQVCRNLSKGFSDTKLESIEEAYSKKTDWDFATLHLKRFPK